jgi:hypothetical protein
MAMLNNQRATTKYIGIWRYMFCCGELSIRGYDWIVDVLSQGVVLVGLLGIVLTHNHGQWDISGSMEINIIVLWEHKMYKP